MKNPRMVPAVILAGALGAGVMAMPLSTSANDIVGDLEHTWMCFGKLITNAPDRVAVCSPVLHESSFSSPGIVVPDYSPPYAGPGPS